jgi:hypothetical protein
MKLTIITSTILMILLSFAPIGGDETCSHCEFIKKNESNNTKLYGDQPAPYIHTDSLMVIQPVIDNIDMSKEYRFIQEIKVTYKDKHYCSDSSKITFITSVDSFSTYNVRNRVSCKINAWFKLTSYQTKLISTYPTKTIVIENLVTDNIYRYEMKDPTYFIKVFKEMK